MLKNITLSRIRQQFGATCVIVLVVSYVRVPPHTVCSTMQTPGSTQSRDPWNVCFGDLCWKFPLWVSRAWHTEGVNAHLMRKEWMDDRTIPQLCYPFHIPQSWSYGVNLGGFLVCFFFWPHPTIFRMYYEWPQDLKHCLGVTLFPPHTKKHFQK